MGRKRGVQYKMGEFYRSDDRSGFTRRASRTKQEWNQLIVGEDLWEARQPQDLVKGVPDDQTVPNARTVPEASFVGPLDTTLTYAAVVGDIFLFLDAINGFTPGAKVGVFTDQGGYFYTTVSGAPISTGIHITGAIPYPCSKGNTVTVFIASPGVFP